MSSYELMKTCVKGHRQWSSNISLFRMSRDDYKIYVGNLPEDVRSRDLEDVFYKYGKVSDIDIHNTRGGGAPFAFVQFDDDRGKLSFRHYHSKYCCLLQPLFDCNYLYRYNF